MDSFEIKLNIKTVKKYRKPKEQFPVMKNLVAILKKADLHGFKLEVNQKRLFSISLKNKQAHVHVNIIQSGYMLVLHSENITHSIVNQLNLMFNVIMDFFDSSNLIQISNIQINSMSIFFSKLSINKIINKKIIQDISKKSQMVLEPYGTIFTSAVDKWRVKIISIFVSKSSLKSKKTTLSKSGSPTAIIFEKEAKSPDADLVKEVYQHVITFERNVQKAKLK